MRRSDRAGFEASRQLSIYFARHVDKHDNFGEDQSPNHVLKLCEAPSLFVSSDLHLGGSALVAEELGVHALGVDVSLALGLLDAVSVLL